MDSFNSYPERTVNTKIGSRNVKVIGRATSDTGVHSEGWHPEGTRWAKSRSDSVLTTGNMKTDARTSTIGFSPPMRVQEDFKREAQDKSEVEKQWNYDWIAGTEG